MNDNKLKSNSSGIVIFIVIAIFIIGYLMIKNSESTECKKDALIAAVDSYSIEDYPNTTERNTLQEAFEKRYLESCH